MKTVDYVGFVGGEILLVRRSSTDKLFPNFWALPGGHIDPGEGCLDAVIREVREETGLSISNKLKGGILVGVPNRPETCVFYSFLGYGSKKLIVPSDETPEVKFIPIEKIKEMTLAFNHNEIIDRIMDLQND